VTFIVEIGQNPLAVTPISCQEEQGIKFETNPLNKNKIPMVIVYSYEELRVENNSTLTSELLRQHLRNINTTQDRNGRRKRQTVSCGVQPLAIDTAFIPINLVGNFADGTIHAPSTYNANICGGFCHLTAAHGKAPLHSIFMSILNTRRLLGGEYNYGQCCGPITFKPLDIFGVFDGVPMARTLPDMIVTECGCTQVVVE